MRELLRNRKGLSPVVAAIILIAVTVAVSIAVAAWMGALTIGFMGAAEQLKIIEVRFPKEGEMTVEVMNTGASDVTIQEVRVDGLMETILGTDPVLTPSNGHYVLKKGQSSIITVGYDWDAGTSYEVAVKTANNLYPVPARAPS